MSAPQAVFVYGLLSFPEVTLALTGKTFETKTALLYGFRRYAVEKTLECGSVPALLEDNAQTKLTGTLLLNVTCEDLALFDFFEEIESDLYQRKRVQVLVEEHWLDAWVYVAGLQLQPYLAGEWSAEKVTPSQLKHLTEQQLPAFLKHYKSM